MNRAMNKSTKLLVLFVLTAAALVAVFCSSLSYKYEVAGGVMDLSPCPMEIDGYEMTPAGGADGMDFTPLGKDFVRTGDDPQLIMTLPQGLALGGVVLDFDTSAVSGTEPLPVQLFYAKAEEGYAERRSVKSVLKPGETAVYLPIPHGVYGKLRFDIDGEFRLTGMTGALEELKSTVYISQDTVRTCMWYFPAIIVGFALIYWAHGVRIRQGGFSGSYLRHVMFGPEPQAGREVYLDYLRVLAALLVILAHTCSPMVDLADAGWKRLVLVCGLGLGLSCNLLYVMISGTLLLQAGKDEKVLSFYVKRASKVIIPLIAYYLLILSLNHEVQFLPPRGVGNAFRRIMTGAPDAGPHLWLIYTIVSLYLVTPFFRVMMQHMSDRMIFSLAAVILTLNVLTTYLPLFGMGFGAATFLSGWEGVFLLGYVLTRQNTLAGASKRNAAIMAAAGLSYIVMTVVVFADTSRMNYVYGSTPVMMVLACGIFCFFLSVKDKFRGKSNLLLRLCSKYSYSIILIHWYALFVVVQGKFHVTALRYGCLGGIAASVALTFLVCIVLAVLFDNTVVIVFRVIFEMLTNRFLRSTGKERA